MVEGKDYVLPYLEWEVLNEPILIRNVFQDARLPRGETTIHITRDEDYKLKTIVNFKDPTFDAQAEKTRDVPGSFAENFDIIIPDFNSCSYTFESAIIGGTKCVLDAETGFSGSFPIRFGGVRMRTPNSNEGTHLNEWFLNGPKDRVFSRITDRRVTKAFSRERLESNGLKFDSIGISSEIKKVEENSVRFDNVNTPLESSSKRVDFLKIKTDELQFLVEKVPPGIGPEWSANVAIEYKKSWGAIPNAIEREEIAEVCSFIFGRQLLPIGYTLYDTNDDIVESYARDPWGQCVKTFCSEPDFPPIDINAMIPNGKAETIINQLLPRYQQLCEELYLKEALWNYWVSRQTPRGTNLPILAAAVETMIHGWFRNKSSSNVYLEKQKFEILIKEELDSIKKKLLSISDGDKIMQNILRANQAGITKTYKTFFAEINLKVTSEEWAAIKERHNFVHGNALFDETDWRLVIQKAATFETLFNKIFLRLLGYSGDYVDHSTAGWPNTQLA